MKAKLDRIDADQLSTNPRATLNSWLRFEQHVKTAMEKHPLATLITPSNLSPETFVSRCRDAIRGKLAFDYPSTLPNDSIARWYSEVIFKVVLKQVYIGPPAQLSSVALAEPNDKVTSLSFDTLSFDELAAFALLLSKGRIAGPVIILSPPPIETLPVYPNLQTISRPNGSLVLI